MRFLKTAALALLIGLAPAGLHAESVGLRLMVDGVATAQQAEALGKRLDALTARVGAMGDVRAEIGAIRTELATLAEQLAAQRATTDAWTATIGGHTADIAGNADLIGENAAAIAETAENIADALAAINARLSALEPGGADPEPEPEPGGEDPPPDPVDPKERTENEKAVLAAVAPLLALDRPGPDVVTVGDGKWFGVADLVTNPQYKGQPGVFGSIEAADRTWRAYGSPEDGGIAVMPGVHVVKNLGRENFFRHVRHIRALDKTKQTVMDCADGWARSDFCLYNASNFVLTMEGFEVRNAYCKNRCAAVGANSETNSRLVMIDMIVRASDNGIRTTGRSVALFRTQLIDNSRSNVAHAAYISNDNRRGVSCPIVVAVDVVSTGNEVAHAFKFRCRVAFILGGRYEGQFGFAIDNAQGGRMLVEDAEIVQKKPSKQWVVIAHGLDKLVRDTGFAAGKNIRRQHRVTNVWRGQSTLRDVVITNELSPGFAGIWNNSKYRLPEKNPDGSYKEDGDGFVYDPASEVFTALPVELINVTVDGQPANDKDVVGPAVVVAP